MTTHAHGEFDVQMNPQPLATSQDPQFGRFALDKQFRGDLQAIGQGEMLTAGTDSGSAVYVAIERVTGTLHGRRGSFILAHRGVMTRETRELAITILADSGTDELVGLTGVLEIAVVDGKHVYDLGYTLP